VTFQATLAGSTVGYALTGAAATLGDVLACNAGSFAFTGNHAALAPAITAATGALALAARRPVKHRASPSFGAIVSRAPFQVNPT
jgi:hypothetical protein